ncbi:hypothetical protein HELRODRAFT_79366 [Helobdella robusta]|uniref:Regulator of telomere elongation helicase 1 homolog n=1 Tax=Helobdella robusta TaxID=6412 RepID=T1G3N2_HELRO|nr:hypothetical protein HELRODRAFT_79366 [Helobdella robusta]ESO04380.1 hypothetical protein HELRODRAFT_79366 [Helobdella robusta]
MPYVDVSGIKINFPYEPYPCQVSYMEKVIESLRTSKNGILESPTGTGKTLCLLCAGLAWLENKKAQIANNRWKNNAETRKLCAHSEKKLNVLRLKKGIGNSFFISLIFIVRNFNLPGAPKIIYASRTHSQLNQAVHEFKRTSYSYMKAVVIGSREQMCIHPTIMKETSNTSKVYMCRAKVSSRSCHFYNQVEGKNFYKFFTIFVFDIEDLLTSGRKNSFCPYYLAKELKKEADVIFMPYNYVLDPKSRKAHGVELQGNILIFDEAHNLERICEESASFDLSSADIASAISDVNRIINKVQEWQSNDIDSSYDPDPISDYNINEVADYKKILLNLEEKLDSFIVGDDGMTLNGCAIFEILNESGLTFDKKSIFCELTEKMISTLTVDLKSSIFTNNGTGLSKLSDVLKTQFSRDRTLFSLPSIFRAKLGDQLYPFHLNLELFISCSIVLINIFCLILFSYQGRILSYWCFSPGYTMADLKDHGVRVILLTSGTLSPLESFVSEFGIDFPVQLENPHVIDSNQVWIGSVEKGPDNAILSSTYEMRFKKEYLISIGNTIVNFNRIVPMGLLIFFPSYVVMEKCIDAWQRNAAIYKRLEATKKIFIEPKDKSKFSTTMQEYYDSFKDPKNAGAIFMAVCRGKVSEGLDFSDNYGRGVVITGLPYPPKKDARVMLKMLFLDEIRKANRMAISGQEWYNQQAWRAVNQALGRVIRHRNDFGAIMLCDIRFRAVQDQLPIWLRSVVKRYTSFGLIVKNLLSFFKLHESEVRTNKLTFCLI